MLTRYQNAQYRAFEFVQNDKINFEKVLDKWEMVW